MIPLVAFPKDCRCFAKGSILEFLPGVNLIVGDQGAGKSTLVQQVALWIAHKQGRTHDDKAGSTRNLAVSCTWEGPPGGVGYMDFEKHNPRTAPGFGMYGLDTASQVQSLWRSHGETVRRFLGLDDLGTGCILLDEPDMALSPRSIKTLAEGMKAAAEKGGQIIAAVHNPALIAAFDRVLSLEHGKWLPSAEFLALQATTPAPTWDKETPRTIHAYLPGGTFSVLDAKLARGVQK